MNPLTIQEISIALTRHARAHAHLVGGGPVDWQNRPWLTLELGRRQTEELDQIDCEVSYSKSGLEAIKAGLRDTIHDGRSWCEFNRIKIRTLDIEDHFALVA